MTYNNLVLALDPSGNYNEGRGTTGWCIANDGYIFDAGQIYAAEFPSQMKYWEAVIKLINKYYILCKENFTVVCEDYRLYASASEAQINSNLETPQLIGVIKFYCYLSNIKIVMQMATEVKHRWSNEVLLHDHIISKDKNGSSFHCGEVRLNKHSLDALRHSIHYNTFKVKARNNAKKKERKFYAYYGG